MSDLAMWRDCSLGEAAGMLTRRVESFGGTRPYVATADVDGYRVAPSEIVGFADRPARADLAVRAGDVFQAKMRYTDKAWFASEEMEGWIASTGFAQFAPLRVGSDPRFIFHLLRSERFLAERDALAVGSTQQAIADTVLSTIRIRVPPVVEQRALSAVLDTLDTTIRQTEAIIEKLKQIKQGLLHDLLTRGIDANGELRPPQSQARHLYKDSPVGWIPKEWDAVRFDALADYVNGNTFDASRWGGQGLPIIRIQNLNGSREFNYYSGPVDPKWHVRSGDLLFAWSGQRGMSFGPRIWPGPEGVLNQHIFRVLERPELVSRRFLFELLRFRQSVIEDAAHGFKASFLHVTRGELGSVLAGVPPSAEQSLIAGQIETIEVRTAGEHLGLEKLRDLKAGLMDDLLTGRVRVTPLLA